MSFNENNFQKLRFDSFGSDKTKKKTEKTQSFALLKKQQQVLKN